MYFLENLKRTIATELKLEQASFSYPPNATLGDLSLACFDLAQAEKTNPAEFARQAAARLKNNQNLAEYLREVRAVGPYLNFFINQEYLARGVVREVNGRGENYGGQLAGSGQKVMIEYSNGNTHKEYHVGHLRNISYGDAVGRLLRVSGQEVIPVSYVNDFGIHVAKTIWNWQHDPSYSQRPEAKGYLLGQCYAAASQKLADDPEAKTAVGQIMKEIESRSGANYALWQETRQWSIDYFDEIYQELGIKFDHIFYESEVIAAGLKLVEAWQAKGIFRSSQGAIIADLEKFGLGVLPIIRSDGTALYAVADLALASEKFTKYKLDESIYVVDVRQSLYFKQLFKILELASYHEKLIHLPYDFVTLPGGMMSSRTGNVVTYEDLKNKIWEKLTTETKVRHPKWSAAKIKGVARNLTVATIKFEMLKVSADKTITFNIEESLRFDGYTACYIEYGYARLRSILRQKGFSFWPRRPDLSQLQETKEKKLLLSLAKYPEVVAAAGAKYNPSELTKYLFELVQAWNDYYHEINILKAPGSQRRARLALITAIGQVLRSGLGLLGINSLEEM